LYFVTNSITLQIESQAHNTFTIKPNYSRGDKMSYVNPALREQFESLSIDLKNNILSRNVRITSIHDLLAILGDIVVESELKGGG
jgi:hypothetical protein